MPANLENSTGLERSIFIPTPKKGNAKECSNYNITAFISHAGKIMLKPFKLDISSIGTENFQSSENLHAGFRKSRGTRD